MLNSKHNLDVIFGFDAEDTEAFKKYIIQIKINALNDVKKTIKTKIPNVTIKEEVAEYIGAKIGASQKVIDQDMLNLNRFMAWIDIKGITYIDTLKHKDIIDFRLYWLKLQIYLPL